MLKSFQKILGTSLVRHKRDQNYPTNLKNAQIEYIYNSGDRELKELQKQHGLFVKSKQIDQIIEWLKGGIAAGKDDRDGDFDLFADLSFQNLKKIWKLTKQIEITDTEQQLLLDQSFYLKYDEEEGVKVKTGITKRITTKDIFASDTREEKSINQPKRVYGIFFSKITSVDYLNALLDYIFVCVGETTFEDFTKKLTKYDLNKNFFKDNPRIVDIRQVPMQERKIQVDKKIPPKMLDPDSLIAKNEKLFRLNSCWIDAAFTCLFSIPGSSIIENIFDRDKIYFEKQYRITFENNTTKDYGLYTPRDKNTCPDSEIVALHNAVIEDILDMHTPTQQKKICRMRNWLSKKKDCFYRKEEYQGSFDDPYLVIKNLDLLYNWEYDKILSFKTIDGPDPKKISNNFKVFIQRLKQRQAISAYKDWNNNNLGGIIIWKDGHYSTYVRDFKKDNWTYIDNRGPTKDIFEEVTTTIRIDDIQDVEKHMLDNIYYPLYFVYYSKEEVARIVGQAIVVPATIAPPPSQPPQELEEEFKKLRFTKIDNVGENEKLLEAFAKETAPYADLTKRVQHVQKINHILLESDYRTSYGLAHSKLQTLTRELEDADTSEKTSVLAEKIKTMQEFNYIKRVLDVPEHQWLLDEWNTAQNALEQGVLRKQQGYGPQTSNESRQAERREKRKEPELKEEDVHLIFRQFVAIPKFQEYYFSNELKELEPTFERPLFIVVTYSNELGIDPELAEDFKTLYGFERGPEPEQEKDLSAAPEGYGDDIKQEDEDSDKTPVVPPTAVVEPVLPLGVVEEPLPQFLEKYTTNNVFDTKFNGTQLKQQYPSSLVRAFHIIATTSAVEPDENLRGDFMILFDQHNNASL